MIILTSETVTINTGVTISVMLMLRFYFQQKVKFIMWLPSHYNFTSLLKNFIEI